MIKLTVQQKFNYFLIHRFTKKDTLNPQNYSSNHYYLIKSMRTEKPISPEESIETIFRLAPTQPRYLLKLLAIGRHQGFKDYIRRKLIWPFLINIEYDKIEDQSAFQWKSKIDRNSTDFQQLQKDAERSLSSMKTYQTANKIHLKKRQNDVLMVLDNFFGHHPDLRYIQGFHDVASVFITIFGNNIGYFMMQKAGKAYFHDFLKFDVGHIGMVVSEIVMDLIVKEDKDFEDIFACFRESLLIFIIPWIFTWFAHVFSSLKTICRIWDYILCTGPFGAIYLTAGLILTTKQQLIEYCEQFDQANIQSFYQKQAKEEAFDIQMAIQKAIQLEEKINVRELSGYAKFKLDSMFRFENFYQEVHLLEKHHLYMQNKKTNQRRINTIKTVTFLLATGTVLLFAYKSQWGKNILKAHFEEL